MTRIPIDYPDVISLDCVLHHRVVFPTSSGPDADWRRLRPLIAIDQGGSCRASGFPVIVFHGFPAVGPWIWSSWTTPWLPTILCRGGEGVDEDSFSSTHWENRKFVPFWKKGCRRFSCILHVLRRLQTVCSCLNSLNHSASLARRQRDRRHFYVSLHGCLLEWTGDICLFSSLFGEPRECLTSL